MGLSAPSQGCGQEGEREKGGGDVECLKLQEEPYCEVLYELL